MQSEQSVDPEQSLLAEVRRTLDERRPAEQTVRAIRRLLDPQVAPQPVELTERGWPVLRASAPATQLDD